MAAFKKALLLRAIVCFVVSCAAVEQSRSEVSCKVMPVGENLASEFKLKASEKGVRMIYLNLEIGNDSYNPLELQDEILPDRWVWARSNNEPMLSLPYDYDILSLGLFTYQVRSMTVPLVDEPSGCLARLNSTSQNTAVGRALLDNVTMDSSGESSPVPKSGVVCVAMIEKDVQTDDRSIKYHCCSSNGPLIHCDVFVEGSNRLRTFLYVILICLLIVVHPYYPALLLMLPDYICNLHYECKKESTELTNSSQAGSIDNAANLHELIRGQAGSTNNMEGRRELVRRFLSENANRYRPRSGHEEAEEEKEEIPADDTSPVTCSTLLLGCVQWLPNLWLSFNFKFVVLMCCIFPFVFYVQLGLYLTLKQKWIHECRAKIPPGKLHSEAWFSFDFTDIDIRSPSTLFLIISGTLVWLIVAFFMRPMDLFLPKGIVMSNCKICYFIPKLARACTCATENQTDQSTETDRRTTENQTDQSTETDRRTRENQTDQSTRTDRRTTENQTDQSTETDRRTTENQTDQSEETYLLADSFQLYLTESQTVQSTETRATDSTPILTVSAQIFLDNLFSESATIGDEAIQHLKLLKEAVYLLMSLFVKQLKGVTSFCSCFLVNKVNLWKLNGSRLSHARFLLYLSLSILFTLILGVVSGAICLVLFFFKLLCCFIICSPSATFVMWVIMKVGFVMAFKTRRYVVYCGILGISCVFGVFYVSYLQVSTICDFIFGILVFSIMGLVLNVEIVTPYVAFFLVVTTNIYCCYANLQNRYKEVKGFILEYWQQELQTTSSEQSTIPTKLFWFVCNREFPVKTEICLMFRNMVVIVTFLFLAIFSIIFFGNTYDISTLVSTIAVFISGAIPSLFFKGLTRGKNFTGWEKIKLRREIETAVKEYPRSTSLYMHCDQESAESGRVGINRESEEVISISRSGHSLVV